jgi:purine-binding chemotaxis protein CheW
MNLNGINSACDMEVEKMNTAEQLETSQFLTFALAEDIFAIDVVMAKEVLDYAEVTRVPQTPDYMLGVINLRGAVVPVIDMRRKFGMVDIERTRDSCIIVVEIELDGEIITIGALADSVQEVMNMNESQIEPPPRIGTKLNTEFIYGMGNLSDKFVIILDINKVFTADELALARAVGGPEEDD